jgi:DNA modification methylase
MGAEVITGSAVDVLRTLEAGSAQTCVTSPPYYGLRDYGVEGQIGLEETPDAYVSKLVEVFREVRRVLRDDGTLWLNIGDSYAGSMKGMGADGKAYGGAKQRTNAGSIGIGRPDWSKSGLKSKDLIGIPWMAAFALRADGWYLRSDIIWSKPNPMPESVTDRPTKAHEYIFLLSKSAKYFYDADAIREPHQLARARTFIGNGKRVDERKAEGSGGCAGTHPFGRNRRSVWTVNTRPFKGAHFATFPEKLIEPCILAGSREGDTVIDPFSGAGTTGVVAVKYGRNFIGIELNPSYAEMGMQRIEQTLEGQPLFQAVTKSNGTPVVADAALFVEPENADSPILPTVDNARSLAQTAGVVQ